MSVGILETLIVVPLAALALLVPVGTLVGVIMIYGKVKRIEERVLRD